MYTLLAFFALLLYCNVEIVIKYEYERDEDVITRCFTSKSSNNFFQTSWKTKNQQKISFKKNTQKSFLCLCRSKIKRGEMAVNKFGGRTKSACSLITRLCVAIDKERCLWHKWAKEERRIESYYKEPDLVFFVNFLNVENLFVFFLSFCA